MRKKFLLTLTAFVMAIAMFSIISYAGKEPATPGGTGTETGTNNPANPGKSGDPGQSEEKPKEPEGIKIDEVNFPDPRFRKQVEEQFDTDKKDGYLSDVEIAKATHLYLRGEFDNPELKGLEHFTGLTNLTIQNSKVTFNNFKLFKNLDRLEIRNNAMESIDLSKNEVLKNITIINCRLKNIDLPDSENVEFLALNNNKIETLKLNKCKGLEGLSCGDNSIKSLDLSENKKLVYLGCSNNLIDKLDLSKNTKLTGLSCSDNKLTELDLSKNTELTSLDYSNNPLGELDLSHNEGLEILNCSKTKIKKLDLKNFPYIQRLYCSDNEIKELDLSSMKKLSLLDCSDNKLEKLDISNNRNLTEIKCKNNKLASLDLSNLSYSSPTVEAGGNKHPIELKSDRTFELKNLPGFDVDKSSKWKGGTVKKGVLTVDEDATEVTYTYDMGKNQKETFTLLVTDPDFQLTRLGGENRIETAIEISRKFFKTSDRVIIARHDNFPDSLTAGVLAKAYGAPILLTETRALNSDVKEEIKRLGAKYVTVIGGTDAISSRVVNELNAMSSVSSVDRLAGENRFETSVKVAEKVVNWRGTPKQVILCTGTSFADSLSISSYAAKNGYPILLIGQNKVPQVVRDFMSKWKIEKVYILGGNLAISSGVEDSLYCKTERIGGVNRYETSKLIAEKFFKDKENCFIASGENFPDALVVGAPAATKDAPIVLTNRFDVNLYTKLLLENSKFKKVNIVGQYLAISLNVESKVETLLKKDK